MHDLKGGNMCEITIEDGVLEVCLKDALELLEDGAVIQMIDFYR